MNDFRFKENTYTRFQLCKNETILNISALIKI